MIYEQISCHKTSALHGQVINKKQKKDHLFKPLMENIHVK